MEVEEPMVDEFLTEFNCSADREIGNPEEHSDHEYHDEDDEDDNDDDDIDEDGSQSSHDDKPLTELILAKDTTETKETKNKRPQCTECEKTYSKRKYLQQHMLREHNIELPKAKRGRVALTFESTDENPRPYKCDQCIKEYTQLRHLTRHKRMHARTFCDFCKKSFAMYDEHMWKEHNVEMPRPFECEICGRSFRVKSTFQAHTKIHHEENRVFNCTLCPKAFFQATDLRKHIKSHSNVRSMICDVCGDAFKSSETLKCHMRRHTGDRPYPCKVCPRAFTTSNSLSIHQRTHTNEKPYVCEVCQKRFSDWSTLLVHKRLHSGESPYVCHICGRRTKQASNLRSHYRHLHKINDISGRQVRMNAKIFERFTQAQIDQHLKENGDLIALLASGLHGYNNEQCEQSEITEKLIETMRAPLRPAKKETKDEESKPRVQTIDSGSRKSNRKIKNEIDATTSKEAKQLADYLKQEPPTNDHDMSAGVDDHYIEIEEKPAVTILSSDQIESVFIIEELDSGAEYIAPAEIKVECDEDQADCWMDGGFDNETNAVHEIAKCEFFADIQQNDERNQKKSIKPNKRTKPKAIIKAKRKNKSKNAPRILLTCSMCPKRVHSNSMNVHMVENHSQVERPFECFLCHKLFKKHSHVSYHLRTHYSDERNFICHMCGDAFVLNAELTKHIFNRHSDIRPFKCDNCDKRFKNRNALKVHMRSHTGEKAFRCSVCSDSFSANSSLRLHFRRHTNEKPYACTHCDKRFSDCSTLRQHERVHTGEKPYVCHICGRRTTQAGNLKSHYRHYHKLVVKSVRMEREKR